MFLLYIILFLLLLLFLLLGYLVIKKILENKEERRKQALKDKISRKLTAHLFNGEPFQTRLLQEGDIFCEVLETLLDNYMNSFKASEEDDRIIQIAHTYLITYYKQNLTNRRWSIRLNTLYQIEKFHLQSFKPDLYNRLTQDEITSNAERYQLVRTLASLQSEQLVEDITSNNLSLPKHVHKELLQRLDECYLEQIITKFDQVTFECKLAIIDYISEKQYFTYIPIVESQLVSTDLELRLASLKALISFGHTSNIEKVLPFQNSKYWEERMLFARLSGVLKKERLKPVLMQLISDSNWYVRNAAGEALSKVKEGFTLLEHIEHTHEDPFARDIAKQWLEIGGK